MSLRLAKLSSAPLPPGEADAVPVSCTAFQWRYFYNAEEWKSPPPPRGNRMVLEARLSRETPILKLSSQEADPGGVQWESVLFW